MSGIPLALASSTSRSDFTAPKVPISAMTDFYERG